MSNQSITVGVVCGGPSPEADVSRLAASRTVPALEKHYGKAVLLELDSHLPGNLEKSKVDVVFPVAYGPLGEDGSLQGLLDIMGIPYVGSGVLGSACSLNKLTAKRILQPYGIRLAKDCVVHSRNSVRAQAEQCVRELGERLIIKPLAQGSGIGIHFVEGVEELISELEASFAKEPVFLVEEFISGREITAGVLDLESTQVLPVIEITTPDNAWYDYVHRYTPGLSDHVIPAPLPEQQYKRVQEIALQAHQLLNCQDISRSDFIVPESGDPVFSELNNLPGMTPTSLFPDAAQYAGIEFESLLCSLIDHALARGKKARQNWGIPELSIKPGG